MLSVRQVGIDFLVPSRNVCACAASGPLFVSLYRYRELCGVMLIYLPCVFTFSTWWTILLMYSLWWYDVIMTSLALAPVGKASVETAGGNPILRYVCLGTSKREAFVTPSNCIIDGIYSALSLSLSLSVLLLQLSWSSILFCWIAAFVEHRSSNLPLVMWTFLMTLSTHYTLHATHYTLHTTHYTLHTTLYTLHTTLYTLHTTHYTLHSTHYTLHTTLYTLHSTHYTLHTTHYTLVRAIFLL
jgi:hypothetical protein